MAAGRPKIADEPAGVPDFSYLRQAIPTEAAEYPLFELEGIANEPPILIVRCTADNEKYVAAMKRQRPDLVKRMDKLQRANGNRRLDPMDVRGELAELLRPVDRTIFPGAIIVGWRRVPDSQRKEVPWSIDNCAAFLAVLPDYIFDGVRTYCADPKNFRAGGDDGEATEVATKNS